MSIEPMTFILYMTYDLDPGDGSIQCRYVADVSGDAIAAVADDPHTAFGIPDEFILDDMDIVPVDSRELAEEENVYVAESTQPLRDFALGPCGCTDYHMADCPTRTER